MLFRNFVIEKYKAKLPKNPIIMSKKINVDYIGAVSLTNSGRLEYRQLSIPKLFDEEMQSLDAMFENNNRAIMDLQDYFQRFMPKSGSEAKYNYCAPHSYSSSFEPSALYPKLYSFNEYQISLAKSKENATAKFIRECNVKKIEDLNTEQKRILDDKILEAQLDTNKLIKGNFIRAARRYMQAFRYYSFLQEVKSDANNKMYSTENFGWTTFKYPIT